MQPWTDRQAPALALTEARGYCPSRFNRNILPKATAMARKLKVAAAQLGPIQPGDSRRAVVARLIELLREAAAMGCELVVYPELALTTFFPRYWHDDLAATDRFFEKTMPGAETQPLFDAATRLGVGFHLGYAELVEQADRVRRFNSAILVGPNGAVVGKYRKIHLPGHAEHRPNIPFQHLEKRYFEVGDLGFPVWRAFGGVLGMAICNDRRWPETYRVLGLQGAEMVLIGYNTPTRNIYHPEPPHLSALHNDLSLQSGAYQNGTWVVGVAKAGAEDGQELMAGSCIVAPTGEIVARALTREDEVIAFDCDLDLGGYIKESVFNFARHRRPEHYHRIVEQTGAQVEV